MSITDTHAADLDAEAAEAAAAEYEGNSENLNRAIDAAAQSILILNALIDATRELQPRMARVESLVWGVARGYDLNAYYDGTNPLPMHGPTGIGLPESVSTVLLNGQEKLREILAAADAALVAVARFQENAEHDLAMLDA